MSHSPTFIVYIYESELDFLKNCVMSWDNIETGGDLFGLWLGHYTLVLQLVCGPGENCKRTPVSFFQDTGYLGSVGNYLTKEEGLCNVGEWHSHHRLSLARPSEGDVSTVWRNMPENLSKFVVCIANISHHDEVNVGCFLFDKITDGVIPGKFKLLKGSSPLLEKKAVQEILSRGAEDRLPTRSKKRKEDNRGRANNEPLNEAAVSKTERKRRKKAEKKNQKNLSSKEERKDGIVQTDESNKISKRKENLTEPHNSKKGSEEHGDKNMDGEQKDTTEEEKKECKKGNMQGNVEPTVHAQQEKLENEEEKNMEKNGTEERNDGEKNEIDKNANATSRSSTTKGKQRKTQEIGKKNQQKSENHSPDINGKDSKNTKATSEIEESRDEGKPDVSERDADENEAKQSKSENQGRIEDHSPDDVGAKKMLNCESTEAGSANNEIKNDRDEEKNVSGGKADSSKIKPGATEGDSSTPLKIKKQGKRKSKSKSPGKKK